MNASCIVLNGDFSYLCTVGWKRAINLVLSDKVKVLKYSDRVINCVERAFRVPAVVLLIRIVRMVYKHRVPYSKKNVLVRDGFKCVYCGKEGKDLTVDHVLPRSRGGKNDFENCVACCKKCNDRKGAKTPREASMTMKKRPYQPTIAEFMRMKLKSSAAYEFLFELGIY